MANDSTNVEQAYAQIKNYQLDIPTLFYYNAFNVISDGIDTRVGTITSDLTRYMAWKSENGEKPQDNSSDFFTIMLNGMFPKKRLLDIIRNFIVFQDIQGKTVKILAGNYYYTVDNLVIIENNENCSSYEYDNLYISEDGSSVNFD